MSNKRTIIIASAAFIAGLALAPVAVSAAQKVFDPTLSLEHSGWDRFDDPDFQVKCWQYDGGYDGGISCLPWNEVKER